jgi:hypothetical protein
LCNCTNGLVGQHCNRLPTPAGWVFDPIQQLIEPCQQGTAIVVVTMPL